MKRWLAIFAGGIVLLVLALWLARARLAAELAQNYFREHGVVSSVEIGALGFSGLAGRIVLGPADAPDFSAERMELYFDPLSWLPRVVEVRLVGAVVRAKVSDTGAVTLPNLQSWLDSLARQQGRSRFVSDDLAVVLSGMRVLLTSSGGVAELTGDARLVHNLPETASLTLKPGTFGWAGQKIRIAGGKLDLRSSAQGYRVAARFSGDIADKNLSVSGLVVQLDTEALRLSANTVSTPRLHWQISARRVEGAGANVSDTALDVTLRNVQSAASGAGRADIRIAAAASLPFDAARKLLARYPVLAMDRPIAAAIAGNLTRLSLEGGLHVAQRAGQVSLALDGPMALRGAKGGLLRVSALSLEGAPSSLQGKLEAALAGGGLPDLSLRAANIRTGAEGFSADAVLRARLDILALRGLDAVASGTASYRGGNFSFRLSRCGRLVLRALAPLAQQISGSLCPGAAPLFVLDGAGWRADGEARNVAAILPLADAGADKASAQFHFESTANGAPRGTAAVSASLTDRATPLRFYPVQGKGDIALRNWVWSGRFAVTDPKNTALATVEFRHVMAGGEGKAVIAAPLNFAPGKLQPASLSPLLAGLPRADGQVDFSGEIGWDKAGLTSHGLVKIARLDFLTPLGTAHAVKADIALKSLLPPVTEDGQALSIARIDWTLPFSEVGLRFSFSPELLTIGGVKTAVAGGSVSLDGFAVNLAGAKDIAGTAHLNGIDLGQLLAVSNLGDKAKLEGKISGNVPFRFGAEGLRIKDGHIAADGPGRLSISRTLWGTSAANANSVQDFAYQALENLAFDSMAADINSIDNGRLQVVFHIKGRSDPPRPQQAEIAVADVVEGTAFQKPIALPSGTPIDLTLDTSLNFDELLKSYAEAWSNRLGQPEREGKP